MLKLSNVFYGWIIVGISTLVFAIVRGVNDAFSVFFVAILEEFRWSRAAVAGVFFLARLTEGTISVGVGMLSDRFGLPAGARECLSRRSGSRPGQPGSDALDVLRRLWRHLCHWLLWAGRAIHVHSSAVVVKKRGTAIGIAMAGMGLGILLIVPLAQVCILHLGWRWAYVILAVIVVVGVIPPTLLWHVKGLKTWGCFRMGTWGGATGRSRPVRTVSRHLTSPSRVDLASCLTPPNAVAALCHAYLHPSRHDDGRAASRRISYRAGIQQAGRGPGVQLSGIFSFIGHIFFGLLSDHLGQITTIILTYSLSIVGTLLLLSLHDPETAGCSGVTSWCLVLALGRVVRSFPPW